VLLRPVENLIGMELLHYDAEVTKPAAFEDDVTQADPPAEELLLAENLLTAMTARKFDIAKYQDQYTAKLTRLIEAKVSGEKLVAPPPAPERPVINLMEALRESSRSASRGDRGAETTSEDGAQPPPANGIVEKEIGVGARSYA